MVVLPPVEAYLLRLVDGADEEADPDGQQLDFGERHPDVTGDDQALVEDPVEDLDESRGVRAAFDG